MDLVMNVTSVVVSVVRPCNIVAFNQNMPLHHPVGCVIGSVITRLCVLQWHNHDAHPKLSVIRLVSTKGLASAVCLTFTAVISSCSTRPLVISITQIVLKHSISSCKQLLIDCDSVHGTISATTRNCCECLCTVGSPCKWSHSISPCKCSHSI